MPVTDALELAEERSFWQQIAYGGMLRLNALRHDDDDNSQADTTPNLC